MGIWIVRMPCCKVNQQKPGCMQALRAGMRDYTVSYLMCLQILLKLAHIHPPSQEEGDEIHLTQRLVFVCFLLVW